MKVTSVYGIICLANGRAYIGSSVNTKKRWERHRTTLRAGTHHARHLQRCWDKYGEGSFTFLVMEEVMARESLQSREQHYIDEFGDKCLNSSPTAGGNDGVVWSDEARKKQSLRYLGRKNPGQAERARLHHSGAKSHFAKLTNDVVREIVRLNNERLSGPKIAARFGVTVTAVSLILKRKTWVSVTEGMEIIPPSNTGTRHHMSKLNEVSARDIKRRLGNGDSKTTLARMYGVHFQTIHDIARGATWRKA